jgi:signal transduction histidine kinase
MHQEKDSLYDKHKKNEKLFNEKDYSKALEESLILLDKAINDKNKEIEYLSSFLIGDCFLKMNNHEKAIQYFQKSLNVLDSSNLLFDNEFVKSKSLSISAIEIRARNYIKLGTEFARINKKDSATFYYNKVVNLNSLNKGLLPYKASAYNNLSGIYIKDSLYNLAKNFALKAVEIRRKNNNKVSEALALSNLANIHVLEKNYIEAKKVYIKALGLIENDNSSKAVKYKEALYYNLAWALYNLEDYTAYDYQEKSYIIKDSLRNAEFEHIVQAVYEKYQANKAKSDVKLKELEERKTNYFLAALLFLILGISGFTLYTYKLRQRNLKLKLEQTEFTQKSKLDKLKSESQIRILNATLDGKETERKQIAETLHDSVSSLLSSANLHLQATKMQFNGDTPIEIDKTQKIIVEASQKIRDLSHTLVSSVLLKFGLKYAIKDMAEKYSNSQINIETNIKGVVRYHQSFEIKVNNIIQEFVNNILKHSNATKAIVRIEDKDGLLHINIQDDGVGFDKKEIPKKDGLGINQIDARIQMMKGKFHINSSSETGTIIEIELPIQEKETTVSA